MTYQRTSLNLRVLMGVVCFILFTPALTGQEQEERQETVYMANIVGVRGPMGGRSVRLTIRIQGHYCPVKNRIKSVGYNNRDFGHAE